MKGLLKHYCQTPSGHCWSVLFFFPRQITKYKSNCRQNTFWTWIYLDGYEPVALLSIFGQYLIFRGTFSPFVIQTRVPYGILLLFSANYYSMNHASSLIILHRSMQLLTRGKTCHWRRHSLRGTALSRGQSWDFINVMWNEVSGSAKAENSMTVANRLQTKAVHRKP